VKDKTRQIPKRTPHASRNAEPERFGLAEPDIVAFCNRLALTSAAPATLLSSFPQETHFMSTRSLTVDEAMRELVTQTRKHLIGQDAAVTAFAAEICRHIALSPLQRGPGIFLVAGPNLDDDHLGLPIGLAATFRKTGGRYELASNQGEDLAHVFASVPDGVEVYSLLHSVKDNPNALFVLQDIDKAQPGLLKTLMTAWNQGFIDDEGGEKIPLAEAIFVLTTEVAQEEIGQIARSEPDPDKLHVACLKALVDAGFPASLLRHVDFTIGLKHLTAGEIARAYYKRLTALIASHGLVLEDGGLDARILLQAIDPTTEPTVPDLLLPWDNLSNRLAQIKTAGARTVRLILDNEFIRILPIEKGTPQWVMDALAGVDPAFSADGEAKDE
jgi:hypothetical protein